MGIGYSIRFGYFIPELSEISKKKKLQISSILMKFGSILQKVFNFSKNSDISIVLDMLDILSLNIIYIIIFIVIILNILVILNLSIINIFGYTTIFRIVWLFIRFLVRSVYP